MEADITAGHTCMRWMTCIYVIGLIDDQVDFAL